MQHCSWYFSLWHSWKYRTRPQYLVRSSHWADGVGVEGKMISEIYIVELWTLYKNLSFVSRLPFISGLTNVVDSSHWATRQGAVSLGFLRFLQTSPACSSVPFQKQETSLFFSPSSPHWPWHWKRNSLFRFVAIDLGLSYSTFDHLLVFQTPLQALLRQVKEALGFRTASQYLSSMILLGSIPQLTSRCSNPVFLATHLDWLQGGHSIAIQWGQGVSSHGSWTGGSTIPESWQMELGIVSTFIANDPSFNSNFFDTVQYTLRNCERKNEWHWRCFSIKVTVFIPFSLQLRNSASIWTNHLCPILTQSRRSVVLRIDHSVRLSASRLAFDASCAWISTTAALCFEPDKPQPEMKK